jgi:hypothetical protein
MSWFKIASRLPVVPPLDAVPAAASLQLGIALGGLYKASPSPISIDCSSSRPTSQHSALSILPFGFPEDLASSFTPMMFNDCTDAVPARSSGRRHPHPDETQRPSQPNRGSRRCEFDRRGGINWTARVGTAEARLLYHQLESRCADPNSTEVACHFQKWE